MTAADSDDMSVFVVDEQHDHPVDAVRWAELASRVLAAEGVPWDTEFSLAFVDEETITALNEQFRDKPGSTDVLSFPLDDKPAESGRQPDQGGTGPGDPAPDDPPLMLGEVVICPAVAARNAPDHAGTYEDELALLVVHGILHLLGLDHEEDAEAKEMETREQAHLDRCWRAEPGQCFEPLPPLRPRPMLPPRTTGDRADALRRRGEEDEEP